MPASILSSYLHSFFQKPKWFQAASLLGLAFFVLAAWPLAVASIYSVVVIKTMRSPVTRTALLLAMIVPALAMEVSWGKMVASQFVAAPTQTAGRSPSPTMVANNPQVQGATTKETGQSAKVLQAVSGDTLDVDINGQPVRIKLLGLDAPNMPDKTKGQAECFAPEAQMFLDSLLRGRTISLRADPQFNQPTTDQSWRYVTMDDGTNVNQLMLQAGLARPAAEDYQQVAEFKAFAEAAKAAQKGLWLNCDKKAITPTPTPTYTQTIKPSASPTPTPNQSGVTTVDPISQGF